MKRIVIAFGLLLGLVGAAHAQEVDGNLPDNFPAITTHVYDANAIGDGYIYLAVASDVPGVGYYLMIVDNDGTPIWYKELPDDYAYDFKLQPNGLLSYAQLFHHHSYSGGGDAIHMILDESFEEIDSFEPGNGYVAESHDFQWQPNGHVLLFGYYMTPMDLSELVDGGYPNAMVSGGVVQELDADRNVVFQWRTWDHYTPEDMSWRRASGPEVSQFHLNTVNMDTDGNLLIATPLWVKKISRQTGEIVWHLGGDENEFTFVGVDPDEAEGHFGGHAFHRLANGNVLIYDNGGRKGSSSSQVHEYRLDEENKIAEHVWTYVPDPAVGGWHRGNAQRLPNGNTLIGWGGDSGKGGPECTEVTPEGEKVFELFFDDADVESYRAFRFPLPDDISGPQVMMSFVGLGDHRFRYGQIDTGVTIRVNGFTGSGYNSMGVRRLPLAPVYPTFEGRAPIVLPVRVQVGASGILTIDGRISFDAASFDLADANEITIYYRDTDTGEPFVALDTTYNPATNQVRADMTAFGEFILGKPDLAHLALAPMLIAPEPDAAVNEAQPVSLDWTPTGFVNSFHLQVATDPDFSELVIDEAGLKATPYVAQALEPGTTYHWRVSTTNDAGASQWSRSTFSTVPPMVAVTVPNGGETWRRGVEYFIQWDDNLAEDVTIELHTSGALVEVIDTVPSTGAYKWEAGVTLEQGDDYTISIRSTIDDVIVDASDTAFSIE